MTTEMTLRPTTTRLVSLAHYLTLGVIDRVGGVVDLSDREKLAVANIKRYSSRKTVNGKRPTLTLLVNQHSIIANVCALKGNRPHKLTEEFTLLFGLKWIDERWNLTLEKLTGVTIEYWLV